MPPSPSSLFRHHNFLSVGFLLRFFEPLLIIVFSISVYYARTGFAAESQTGPMAMTALVVMFYMFGSTALRMFEPLALRSLIVYVPRLLAVLSFSFGTLVTLLFFFKISSDFSRVWLASWFVLSLLGLLILRAYVSNEVKSRLTKGQWARRIVILGTNTKAVELVQALRSRQDPEYRLVGVYDMADVKAEALPKGISKYLSGHFSHLLDHCRQGKIDDVILTENLDNNAETLDVINRLNSCSVNVFYCLPLSLISCMGGNSLPLIMISRKPMEGHSVWLKRLLDVFASGAILLMILPILLILAGLVKLSSPGPVFFRQQRGGFNGKTFEMLKFRSMRVGASAVVDQNGKEKQALKNDPRITAVGRFLRRSSLDELPQLINVLRGDMSLVGPRPHVPSHDSYYGNLIDTYASRQRMKPGITGWAQLNGWRGETETLDKMAKRVEFDIWYTQNWSFWLDIKILFLTPFVTLFQKEAY